MKHQNFRSRMPLGYLIHEVARLIKRRFEEEAQGHGITLPQWKMLAALAQHGEMSQSAISAETETDPMTVSGILDRLDKRGLVERFADPTDSRAKVARLTGEGRTLYAEARSVGLEIYDAAMAGVSQTEQTAAIGVLSKMRKNLLGEPAHEEEIA